MEFSTDLMGGGGVIFFKRTVRFRGIKNRWRLSQPQQFVDLTSSRWGKEFDDVSSNVRLEETSRKTALKSRLEKLGFTKASRKQKSVFLDESHHWSSYVLWIESKYLQFSFFQSFDVMNSWYIKYVFTQNKVDPKWTSRKIWKATGEFY